MSTDLFPSAGRRTHQVAAMAVCALIAFSGPLVAEEPASDVSTYSFHCYCLGAYRSPQRVVALDNNGRLLALARSPMSRAQIEAAGVSVTDSQLRLLTDYNLLRRSGESYRTNFTIVDPPQMGVLRNGARTLARRISPSLREDIAQIRSVLRSRGLEDSLYATVFGLGLDGAIWDSLAARGLLPDTTPDAAHPLWRGVFWAISSRKEKAAGVNALRVKDAILFLTWTDSTSAALNKLLEEPNLPGAVSALASGATNVKLTDSGGGEWTLAKDRSAIPIIDMTEADALFLHTRRIGERLAQTLVGDAEGRALVSSISGASPSDGLLIVAHELIWAVDDALVADGSLDRPRVLEGGAMTPATLRPLLLLVRHKAH
jgi:hypothetical protein